jgi:hypothetical protein
VSLSPDPSAATRPASSRTNRLREAAFFERLDGLLLQMMDRAEAGDAAMARLLLRSCAPATRPITFAMPPSLDSVADCARAVAGLLAAVAAGAVTPKEAALIGRLLESQVRLLRLAEAERARVAAPAEAAARPAPQPAAPAKKQRNTMEPLAGLEALLADLTAAPAPRPPLRHTLLATSTRPLASAA